MATSRRVDPAKQEYVRQVSSQYVSFPRSPYPHSILLVFKSYDYKKPEQSWGLLNAPTSNERTVSHSLKSFNSIELPFPKQLQDNTGLRINGYERDPLMEGVVSQFDSFTGSDAQIADIPKLLQSYGSGIAAKIMNLSKDGGSGAVNKIIKDALGTNVNDVAQAAKYMLQKNLPSSASRNFDNVTGQTINPRETLAFEGVNLRTHQFSWDLYPSNKEDTEQIKKIINILKWNSLPETADILGIPKAFLKYPSIVETYLIGIKRDYYVKFKPSMVTQLNVDYGPGGSLAIMKGGVPAGVNISLTMQELEIETKEDYTASAWGYNPNVVY